jgi:tRNA-splicing ligase RtcB (3'-phosphate/5'-hydroxy nucleic acid ligase)
VPHGRTNHGGKGDVVAWQMIPARNAEVWQVLKPRYDAILEKHPKLDRGNHANHLGTLGTGNHFLEVCLDEAEHVWFMLHSGPRGVGNRGETPAAYQPIEAVMAAQSNLVEIVHTLRQVVCVKG